jgi:L-fuculose-phosphate aldolase
MKPVISARDIEELLRTGGDPRTLPADAIFTPSARDLVRDLENKGDSQGRASGGRSAAPVKPVTSKSAKADLEAFFNSPAIHGFKEQLCEIGRRLWQRAYVDGNGGNLAIRVGEDIALCTPTLVSKGFMKPEDMCLVDLDGNQLVGA